MKKLLPLFIVLGLSFPFLFAQQNISITRTYRPSSQVEQDMVFLYYPYKSNILDLAHFRDEFPQSRTDPQSRIVILPPDLSSVGDTVYGITYFPPKGNRPGKMVIIIIGNYNTPNPLYFIDYNMDRNYANDGPPYMFGNEESATFAFQNNIDASDPYVLKLLNPQNQKDLDPNQISNERKRMRVIRRQQKRTDYDAYRRFMIQEASKMRESSRLGLRTMAVVNFGGIRYRYIHGVTGYPTNYKVDFNTKGIMTNLTWRVGHFKVGVIGKYENIFYWSSTRVSQVGEPFLACNDLGACMMRDNIQKEFNNEILPRHRASYGVSAEYGFRISTMTFLAPFFRVTAHQYLPNKFVPRRLQDPETFYQLGPNLTFEGGLMLVTDISRTTSFVAGLHAANLNFEPQNYFEQFDPQNLFTSNRQAGFSLGFQFRMQ